MNLIALVDENWALGFKGQQIIYIPDDLKRFKALTAEKTVILGRKTLDTFPGKKPLKNRRNLILSRDDSFKAEGAEVFRSIEEILFAADEDSFVIGGESVYKELLPYCGKAYITKVDAVFEADRFLPSLDKSSRWILCEESPKFDFCGLKYSYRIYERAKL